MKMELLEKTSTQVYKYCPYCKQVKGSLQFYHHVGRHDGLRAYCIDCEKLKGHIYGQSERGKIARRLKERRYYYSEAGGKLKRAIQGEYASSLRGKLTYRKWRHSTSGELSHFLSNQRYYNSPLGYAYSRGYSEQYRLSGLAARGDKERYARKQDEANCHIDPKTFYPAYRMIKALETAEVVEIKL